MADFWRSKVKEDYVKLATGKFAESCGFPDLLSARVDKLNTELNQALFKTVWSQDSPELGKKRTFVRMFSENSHLSSFTCCSKPIQLESGERLAAFNDDFEVIITKTKSSPKGEDVHILEVWDWQGVTKTYNLTALDLHGNVYFDAEFGSVAINLSGTKVAYVAEQKRPKNVPFFPTHNKSEDNSSSSTVGMENQYVEDFGEQLVGKSQPVIVTLELATGTFKVEGGFGKNFIPGQLQWLGDDALVGIFMHSEPNYRLGIIYCSNRPSYIFKLDLSSGTETVLSKYENVSCRSPRVSPDQKTVVWLERDVEAQPAYPGPHQACFRLMACDMTNVQPRVVIDVQSSYEPGVDTFAGVFTTSLPTRCFVTNDTVIFSTPVGVNICPVVANIETSTFDVISTFPGTSILDVTTDDSIVLASTSTLLKPPTLGVSKFVEDGKFLKPFHSLTGKSANGLPDKCVVETTVHRPTAEHPDVSFRHVKFTSIYVGPSSGAASSIPLIVWPHGGPHSLIATNFSAAVYYWTSLGYAVLLVNYRGSTGHGQDSVYSLLSHVGDLDVKDCHQAKEDILSKYSCLDASKVVLLGGSHGGFLVTHLAGQYPDDFKAVVARNPVINIATMSTVSDITDWTFNEAGYGFSYKSPSPEIMKVMYEKSPIAHVGKVKAPVYLMVGKEDLRVPPSQGYEYYHNLKALGKRVDMNVYEDCHPLSKVPIHSNVFINAALFYHAILGE